MNMEALRKIPLLAALCLLLSSPALAEEPVTPKLTDKLRQLLQEEMRAIQTAMTSIHTAMVLGQHHTVAEQARQIHDSFILKQSLTEQDRRDLKAAVPAGFIALDQEFHELAASLENAGRNKESQEQGRLFSSMTHSCIECHGKYVSDRFPAVHVGGAREN